MRVPSLRICRGFLTGILLVTPLSLLRAQQPTFSVICQRGYNESLCREHSSVLRALLDRLRPKLAIEPWTWVLVPRGAWSDVTHSLGHHPHVPALTIPSRHQTWVDGELLGGPSVRQFELRNYWHTEIPALREVAVSHELAHIICPREAASEATAIRVGTEILHAQPPVCSKRKPRPGVLSAEAVSRTAEPAPGPTVPPAAPDTIPPQD